MKLVEYNAMRGSGPLVVGRICIGTGDLSVRQSVTHQDTFANCPEHVETMSLEYALDESRSMISEQLPAAYRVRIDYDYELILCKDIELDVEGVMRLCSAVMEHHYDTCMPQRMYLWSASMQRELTSSSILRSSGAEHVLYLKSTHEAAEPEPDLESDLTKYIREARIDKTWWHNPFME